MTQSLTTRFTAFILAGLIATAFWLPTVSTPSSTVAIANLA